MHEKEILEMRSNGMTKREIGDMLGLNIKQITNFVTRYNTAQGLCNFRSG